MAFETVNNAEYEEIKKAFEDNGANITDKLVGQIRAGENGFQKGDHIEWPDKIEYLSLKIGNSGNRAQAILCKITGEDGAVRYGTFFPNSLNKRIYKIAVDDDGNYVKSIPAKLVRPDGQAAKDYQSKVFKNADDVFKQMVTEHPNGLKVTNVRSVDILVYRTTDVTTTNLYTFDYA